VTLAVTITIPPFWTGVIAGVVATIALIVVLAIIFGDEK
jgi:hypothetical protein